MKILFNSKLKSKKVFMGRFISYFLLIISLAGSYSNAQIYTQKDVEVFNAKFKLAVSKNLAKDSIGDVIASIGKSFIGTEYAAHSLEQGKTEELVIDLTGLDCTTFLENALAFARCIKENKTSFEDYEKELTKIRYRNGVINGYASRLNYFSDWIFNNEEKGIIKNISKKLGGVPVKFNVNFMSAHSGAYVQLKENHYLIPLIENQEKEISERLYYYIPKEKVAAAEKEIHNGDLIAFTSAIKGLDINHVGIAVKGKGGSIYLMHAPNVGYKVQIADEPLSVYISKVKKDTGIIVLRALEPGKL